MVNQQLPINVPSLHQALEFFHFNPSNFGGGVTQIQSGGSSHWAEVAFVKVQVDLGGYAIPLHDDI
jgi:hypothetical protein